MKNNITLLLLTITLSVSALFYSDIVTAKNSKITVTSESFKEGEKISIDHVYQGFGCNGKNLSPQLSWNGAPEGTKSYIITAYDPDAPTGSGWWHWTMFNIPASVTSLAKGIGVNSARPEGSIEGRTDFGNNGFGGPCPPEGDLPHRYIFTVYAMPDAALQIDESASGAMVGFFANSSALAKGEIIAKYGR